MRNLLSCRKVRFQTMRKEAMDIFTIRRDIDREQILMPSRGVFLERLSEGWAEELSYHYRQAFGRGDFFGSRYPNLESSIFNPDWIRSEVYNPEHVWILFVKDGELVGSTGLFFEKGTASIDETQIGPRGRGLRIMNDYFRFIVPLLEKAGFDITTEFVLTPESKGLRRTLQQELGMVALGICPHNLYHRGLNFTASEISAAKYQNLRPTRPIIVPELFEIFEIVASQVQMPAPEVVELQSGTKAQPPFGDKYTQIPVSGTNPLEQKAALDQGYKAVKFDPRLNVFTMAKFPPQKPDIDFLIGENIRTNTRLVQYLNMRLFGGGE